ncbi:MAG: sigma-70 family RNA polymerase sigma factor [Propionibacteriaceae bacterium]|nr:sigma-70 family RNA polymerase sigma factor [Propionibacteriaceae bacterium]
MTETTNLVTEAATLFEEFRDGERGQIDPLVRLLTPTLWHMARACGLQQRDAEDVVQTVWLSLVSKADTVRDPRSIVAWLGTSVRRESWRTAREKRLASPREDFPEHPDPAPGPDEVVLTSETQRTLWRHLAALTPRCQALLRIISRGGPPDYAALADAWGMPVGSIGPTRGRCLSTLRKALLADPSWSAT